MNVTEWVQEEMRRADGDLINVSCPLFSNGLCSIYENRPSCCRNFPQSDGYCSWTACAIAKAGIAWSETESSSDCTKCQSKCCASILVPATMELTSANVVRWLDISCEDCRKLF